MSKSIKILHLTPHLGSGVGAVVLNYLDKAKDDQRFEHSVVCLDDANNLAKSSAALAGYVLLDKMHADINALLELIAAADIVLVHWWNHPLLYDFLVRNPLPPSRVIFWSHVTGLPAPNNYTVKLLNYPDQMVFTTPLSLNLPIVKTMSQQLPGHFSAIWSTGGVERLNWLKLKSHTGINIGYAGSLDPAKLHPDFLKLCAQVNIPDLHFIIVGGPDDQSQSLAKEATRLGLSDRFTFTGFVSEEEKWRLLSTFDLFAYPLAPHHYGSSDQILQEAMSIGLVPIVFANPMESLMVDYGGAGIIANNSTDYIKALEDLATDNIKRQRLGERAKNYAQANYSLVKMEQAWDDLFAKTLTLPKTTKKWPLNTGAKQIAAHDIFLESLGDDGQVFLDYCLDADDLSKEKAISAIKNLSTSPNWRSASKGTAHQYHAFFPDDDYLALWSSWTH
jgi:glycosyltransferase involved in cell wall biosynthesis